MSDFTWSPSRRVGASVFILLALTGCSVGDEPAEESVPEAVPVQIEPLTDAQLMGISRQQVILTLPWSEGVVARDPNPAAARATLRSVELSGGEGFDRVPFEFGTDAAFPGYRVAWNDTTNAMCADGPAPDLGAGRTLLIRF